MWYNIHVIDTYLYKGVILMNWKDIAIVGAVGGAYRFARDMIKVQYPTLYKYPWLIDAGAFLAGYLLRKYLSYDISSN